MNSEMAYCGCGVNGTIKGFCNISSASRVHDPLPRNLMSHLYAFQSDFGIGSVCLSKFASAIAMLRIRVLVKP